MFFWPLENVSALKNQPANSLLQWIHPYDHARSVPVFLINKKRD
ncbi:hypothetical protein BSI_04770 [Bacillus inaquosorum KCTC 13429]|uniref:Uncharacterized protein n=1 Tax=Bacillus inaquosorum KCTC 13429 TaxID=1236548 RepID=A0A9W5LLW2_9BACI|nr:hypothetical protein BSI_04770 [Bacillus inaquosorum KCTC 13429]